MQNRAIKFLMLAATITSFSIKTEPGIMQNIVVGQATRFASKLYIAPAIVAHIKNLATSANNQPILAQSMAQGFDSKTRADATTNFHTEHYKALNASVAEKSITSEIVEGEISSQTDLIVREALAWILSRLKIASKKQGGSFRLGMDYFGTTYDIASDGMSAYNAIANDQTGTNCNDVRTNAAILGFLGAYGNLAVSGTIAGFVMNPILSTMAFLGMYLMIDPLIKHFGDYALDMQQCPGAPELYGLTGDICYFATGVMPDNIHFANPQEVTIPQWFFPPE